MVGTPRSFRSSAGFTLVETSIGLALLATLSLTTCALVAFAREATTTSRRQVLALTLARSRLEQLEGLAFSLDLLESGGTVETTDLVTDLSVDPPGLGGPGLGESPPDALVQARPGYVDYLDAQGRWLGNDTAAWARAAFVRRWTVRRVGGGAGEWVAFEVLAAPAALARRATAEELLSNPAVLRLQGALARRAR